MFNESQTRKITHLSLWEWNYRKRKTKLNITEAAGYKDNQSIGSWQQRKPEDWNCLLNLQKEMSCQSLYARKKICGVKKYSRHSGITLTVTCILLDITDCSITSNNTGALLRLVFSKAKMAASTSSLKNVGSLLILVYNHVAHEWCLFIY